MSTKRYVNKKQKRGQACSYVWRPNITNPPNPITPPTPTATSGAGCAGPDVNNGQVLATPFAANLPACYPSETTPPCCASATCGADLSTLVPKYYSVGVQSNTAKKNKK